MPRNGDATGVARRGDAPRAASTSSRSRRTRSSTAREPTGVGYAPDDEPGPPNPYGASKLRGERAAREAYRGRAGRSSAIARTAWLFGPGKPDFPTKILASAERARAAGEPLRVVGDEWGTPTYVDDVADAIVELLGAGEIAGIHHLVNGLFASRAEWAR